MHVRTVPRIREGLVWYGCDSVYSWDWLLRYFAAGSVWVSVCESVPVDIVVSVVVSVSVPESVIVTVAVIVFVAVAAISGHVHLNLKAA